MPLPQHVELVGSWDLAALFPGERARVSHLGARNLDKFSLPCGLDASTLINPRDRAIARHQMVAALRDGAEIGVSAESAAADASEEVVDMMETIKVSASCDCCDCSISADKNLCEVCFDCTAKYVDSLVQR